MNKLKIVCLSHFHIFQAKAPLFQTSQHLSLTLGFNKRNSKFCGLWSFPLSVNHHVINNHTLSLKFWSPRVNNRRQHPRIRLNRSPFPFWHLCYFSHARQNALCQKHLQPLKQADANHHIYNGHRQVKWFLRSQAVAEEGPQAYESEAGRTTSVSVYNEVKLHLSVVCGCLLYKQSRCILPPAPHEDTGLCLWQHAQCVFITNVKTRLISAYFS